MTNFFVAGPKFSLNVLRVRLVSNFSRASNFIHFRKSLGFRYFLRIYLNGYNLLRCISFYASCLRGRNFIYFIKSQGFLYSLRTYLNDYKYLRGFKNMQSGFTLIEMLVVMGILTMLGSLALFVNLDTYYGFMFRSERDTLISTLQKARSQSMNNICLGAGCVDGKPHGVHVKKGEYTIFQGGSYAARDTAVDEIIFSQNNAIELSTTSLEVVFGQLSGDIASVQEIGLFDNAGHHSTTSINTEGRISWTN